MTDSIDPNKIMHLNDKFKKDAEAEMQEFANPLDFIIADRKKRQVEVSGPTGTPPSKPLISEAPPPEQPKVPMVAIDGYVFPGDTVTLMLYSLVTLARKDKKLAKVLKSFKYIMRDVNGEQIFP